MGFTKLTMIELEKLEFKLIIGLVIIFNYIVWIDINLISIDAIRLEFAVNFWEKYDNCRFCSIGIIFLFNIQLS